MKRIFLPYGTFFFFLSFFGRPGLGYEAQAGFVFFGNFKFPEQHILAREKLNSATVHQLQPGTESRVIASHWTIKNKYSSLMRANENPVRLIICKVENRKEHAVKANGVASPTGFYSELNLSLTLWNQ